MVETTINEPTLLENGMVSQTFSVKDGDFVLVDAIVLVDAQFAVMSAQDIAAEVQRRWDEWYLIVTAPEVVENG